MEMQKMIVLPAAVVLGMALVAPNARADIDISVFASKQNVSLVEAAGAVALAEAGRGLHQLEEVQGLEQCLEGAPR